MTLVQPRSHLAYLTLENCNATRILTSRNRFCAAVCGWQLAMSRIIILLRSRHGQIWRLLRLQQSTNPTSRSNISSPCPPTLN